MSRESRQDSSLSSIKKRVSDVDTAVIHSWRTDCSLWFELPRYWHRWGIPPRIRPTCARHTLLPPRHRFMPDLARQHRLYQHRFTDHKADTYIGCRLDMNDAMRFVGVVEISVRLNSGLSRNVGTSHDLRRL